MSETNIRKSVPPPVHKPAHPMWNVRVSFEYFANVSAPNAREARLKAIAQLGRPSLVQLRAHAIATPVEQEAKAERKPRP